MGPFLEAKLRREVEISGALFVYRGDTHSHPGADHTNADYSTSSMSAIVSLTSKPILP